MLQKRAITKFFNEATSVFWRYGIICDNILPFISDPAPYILKIEQAFICFYRKTTHFTCVGHVFHVAVEYIRDNYPKIYFFISSVKKVFLKAPSRVSMLKEMYSEIPLPTKTVLSKWGNWLEVVKLLSPTYRICF